MSNEKLEKLVAFYILLGFLVLLIQWISSIIRLCIMFLLALGPLLILDNYLQELLCSLPS